MFRRSVLIRLFFVLYCSKQGEAQRNLIWYQPIIHFVRLIRLLLLLFPVALKGYI